MTTEIAELLERIAGNLEGIAAALDETNPSLSMWARDLAHSIDKTKHDIKNPKLLINDYEKTNNSYAMD